MSSPLCPAEWNLTHLEKLILNATSSITYFAISPAGQCFHFLKHLKNLGFYLSEDTFPALHVMLWSLGIIPD